MEGVHGIHTWYRLNPCGKLDTICCYYLVVRTPPHVWFLSRPTQEYRGQIDKKYRRNIEAIVRRPNRDEEPEPMSKCPISGAEVPITLLECPSTKVGLGLSFAVVSTTLGVTIRTARFPQ